MAWYHSRHRNRCPRLTPDHRHIRCILEHRHQNWSYQQWTHVMFLDVSKISLNHSDRPVSWIQQPRLVYQQHDETFWIGQYISMGWPWTHQQISDETTVGGFSLGPACQHVVAWRWSGVSLGICLDNCDIQLLLNIFGPCRQRHGFQLAWPVPLWSRTLWKSCSPHDTE